MNRRGRLRKRIEGDMVKETQGDRDYDEDNEDDGDSDYTVRKRGSSSNKSKKGSRNDKTKNNTTTTVTNTTAGRKKRRKRENNQHVPVDIGDIEEVHAKLLVQFPQVTEAMKRFEPLRAVSQLDLVKQDEDTNSSVANVNGVGVLKSETKAEGVGVMSSPEEEDDDKKLLGVKKKNESNTGIITTATTDTVTGAAPGLCGASRTILEAVVNTILSQNTSDKNSLKAVTALNRRFGTDWNSVLDAPESEVEETIRWVV